MSVCVKMDEREGAVETMKGKGTVRKCVCVRVCVQERLLQPTFTSHTHTHTHTHTLTDDHILAVTELQTQGVNAADIAKLNEAGISTVGMILKVPLKVLLGIKGFSEGMRVCCVCVCVYVRLSTSS